LNDRASEPEKLRITADYFGITGDLEKEVSTYELWIKEYPRDDEAHGNLGVDYNILGQNDKALVEAKRALQLASDDINIYQNLVGLYISLNRLDDAKATADKALANHMAGSILHYSLYQIAFLQGQSEKMQEQMTWAAGEPASETVMLSTQADSEAYYGKMKAAAEFEQRAVALDVQNDSKESAASWKVDDALRSAEVEMNRPRGWMRGLPWHSPRAGILRSLPHWRLPGVATSRMRQRLRRNLKRISPPTRC
jgi:tetratricopeptide (TPR) repeat protein